MAVNEIRKEYTEVLENRKGESVIQRTWMLACKRGERDSEGIGLARGPTGPGCCLKMAAAMCNQICRYCNSELPGSSRQMVLHWWLAISLLTVVRRSESEP